MNAAPPLLSRSLASAVREALADTPVVCLLGPRQSGKTTLAQQLAPERAFISLDDPSYYRTATGDPAGLVASLPDAATVDEVQRAPALLPAIKHAVDRDRRPGRFLLTGSANLLLAPAVTESLAGRMEIVQLHPLTESEKARRPGRFLNALLAGAFEPDLRPGAAPAGPSLAERLVAGGYPEPLARTPRRARQWHRQYLRSIIERDVREVARVRDAHELGRLLELLALRSAELFNATRLANDLGLRRETVEHYVAVLERLFLVRRLPAWRRNPANRLVTSPEGASPGQRPGRDPGRPDRGPLALRSRPRGTPAGIVRAATARRPGRLDRSRPAVLALSRQGPGGGRRGRDPRFEDLGGRGQGGRHHRVRRRAGPRPARRPLRRGFRVRRAALRRPGTCCHWATGACSRCR